jgi:hypothetical protein
MTGRGDVTLDVIGCRQRRLTAPVAWGADGQAGHTGSDTGLPSRVAAQLTWSMDPAMSCARRA